MLSGNLLSVLCGVWYLSNVCNKHDQATTTPAAPTTSHDDRGFDLLFTTNREEMLDVPIQFEKRVPRWLKGTLIRNGLGVFENGNRKFKHAFDAFSKLTSWRFEGKKRAYFSTRLLRSQFYNESMKTKTIAPFLMFETVEPPFNRMQKMEALLRGIDNLNVNVYSFNKKKQYVVLSDFWKLYEINPRNLTTGNAISNAPTRGMFEPRYFLNFLNLISTAHPLPFPGTDWHLSFLSSVSLLPWVKSAMNLIKIKSAEDREIIARWEVDKVPYMHSFSVTQHYAVLFASPFYVNVLKMAMKAEPFRCLDWHPDEETTVYVVNLNTGKVHTLKTGNVFIMHHVNAYEVSMDHLVVDVSAYTGPEAMYNFEMKVIMDPVARNKFDVQARVQRYDIFLDKQEIKMKTFPGGPDAPYTPNLDLPTINEKYRSRPYCITYGVVMKRDNSSLSDAALVKKNLCNHLDDKAWFKPYHFPEEAWFVPDPKGTREDDGILLLPILNGLKNRSFLAIMDARTLTIVSRAYLPTVLPFSFHGRLFPEVV